MRALSVRDKICVDCRGLYWFRGCEGTAALQVTNDRSGVAHGSLEGAGPSAPCKAMRAFSVRDKIRVDCRGLYWISRLRGTAALQVTNDRLSLAHGIWRASRSRAIFEDVSELGIFRRQLSLTSKAMRKFTGPPGIKLLQPFCLELQH